MKTFLTCVLALVFCIAVVQGGKTEALSRRSNTCNNHGYCALGNNGWACRCNDGWGGRDCVKEMKPASPRRQLAGQPAGAGEDWLRRWRLRRLLKQIMSD